MKNLLLRYGLLLWCTLVGMVVGGWIFSNTQVLPGEDIHYFSDFTHRFIEQDGLKLGNLYVENQNLSIFSPLVIFALLSGMILMLYTFYALKKRGISSKLPLFMLVWQLIFFLPPVDHYFLPRFIFWFVGTLLSALFLQALLQPITKFPRVQKI